MNVLFGMPVIHTTGGFEGEADRRQVFSSIDSALYQAKAGGRNRTVRAELS